MIKRYECGCQLNNHAFKYCSYHAAEMISVFHEIPTKFTKHWTSSMWPEYVTWIEQDLSLVPVLMVMDPKLN